MENERSVSHFFERGPERLNQCGREISHEADRIAQQNILIARQTQPASHGIEGGE